MSDVVLRICFSNSCFRWVKRVFFHHWVLWPVGGTLAVGLPLALGGVAIDRIDLLLPGLLLTFPFQLWVGLLAAVSFVLAVPRLAVVGLTLVAVYFGLGGLAKRLAEWAAKYEERPKSGDFGYPEGKGTGCAEAADS